MPDLPIVRILKAVADGTRLKLLLWLLTEPATQKELGAKAGLPSGTMSRHLGVLEDLGLIGRQRTHGPYRVLHFEETRRLIQDAARLATATTAANSELALDTERDVRRTLITLLEGQEQGS